MKKSKNKDIIYQGNSIISIEHLPGYSHPVVIKKPSKHPSSRRNIQSLEKEYDMTRALDAVEGVRKALGQQSIENHPALILEYIDGETLRDHLANSPLDLRSRLEIAIDLARILGGLHQLNVIHLDLNSKNILIANEHQAVRLIDLGSAAHIDRSGQQKVRPDQVLGTLPYISPEQTGRINRAVDERSDLYSLGVVLYELMTGQLPFVSRDPLELVHDHIARVPVSPSEVSSETPEVLSAIILKLLSKNAEDRYQSAVGVQADLEKCLQRLSPEDTIEEFPLGEADYSIRFRYPQALYGRESELKILEGAFESACRDTSSFVFVGGYSGIGKTALVEEIQPVVSNIGGYFARGKFDQYLRTTPYTAITSAFAEFVSQILTEYESAFTQWQDEIQAALGDLGQVLIDVIPALEKLVGTQPDVPQLGGHEAENRFNFVFLNFLSTVVTKERPLVLFIDDLQWIDAASLRLLEVIRSDFNQPGLLVIGAYRDNEVDASHPLMGIIRNQEDKGLPLLILKLDNLQQQHLETFLSDTLKSQKGIKELGGTIYEKTGGNPFFSRRLLSTLHEESHIRYDVDIHKWRWNLGDIHSEAIAESVADLLAKNLAKLPEDTKKVLNLAACIGNRFDIPILALISGYEEQELVKLLSTSSSEQYVLESGNTFEFVHDQVQKAAYTLVDANSRISKHLDIGRLLLANTSETELDEQIFDIVNHYHQGVELLSDRNEKIQLAELNLAAGRKAKLSSAFSTAAEYFRRSVALLDDNKWDEHYELTLHVYNELIQACYLTIQNEEVRVLFDTILNHVKNNVDSTVAYKTLIMSNIAQNKLLEAISLAEGYLELLNISFDTTLDSKLTIDELRELPLIENKEKMAALEILLAVDTPFIYAMPERIPSLIYTMLNIISKYGNSYVSGPAYTWHAFFLCFGKQYHEGNLFGRLGVDLLKKHPYPGMASKIMDFQYAYLLHWEVPVHDLIVPLKDYYRVGMQEGNFEWGLYCLLNHSLLMWSTGKPLGDYLSEVEPSIAICKSKNHEITLLMFLMFAESACNLTGRSVSKTQLEGKWFSEEKMISKLEGNDMLLALFELIKVTHYYLFGDVEEAYQRIDKLLKYRASLNPHYLYTKISFYGGLSSIASLSESENDADRQDRLANLEQFEEDLKLWAEVAPMNYQHQYDLVMAEKSRVANEKWNAVKHYEAAITGANENLFFHDEALASELFGKFWLEQGNNTIAKTYMRKAYMLYHQWGADAKVNHLEKCFLQRFQTESIPIRKSDIPAGSGKRRTSITQTITPIQLDMESIISASHVLSAETDLEQLLTKMITLVLANSGAETAVLLLKQDNDWFVQARGDSASEKYDVLLNQSFDPASRESGLFPESVFHYCSRSKDMLVVGDINQDTRFAKDRTVQKQNVKSLACIPILSQGKLKALLYLENRQLTDVFTLKHMEILKHLSAQFGVSVENALLYENLSHKISELRESEARFRSVVENANETIVVAQDESVKYCNNQITDLTGYLPQEMLSRNFTDFIHPKDMEAVLTEYQTRLSGEKPAGSYSIRIITRDGQVKYVLINSALIDWNGRPATLAMLTDITELKIAEGELLKSEELFRQLMEQSPLAMEILSPEGKIEVVNSAWRKLWKVTEEEAAETLEKYNMLTDPQLERLGLMDDVKEAFKGKHTVLPPIQYDTGQTIDDFALDILKELKSPWIQCHLNSVKDPTGKIVYIVNAYVDITKLKNAEEDVRQAYHEIKILKDQLQAESTYLQQEIKLEHNFENIIGQSEALKYVLNRVEKVAPTDYPVLIMGETGTGKELMARAIHQLSPHSMRAMVKVNCAALPADLIESELFGREKGAFTGATTTQPGRFELAKGSTLFLDEIGELPLELQAKLLRVLESGEFERLGSPRTRHSDARVIAATNRVLEEEVRKGHFRDDLWYRLKVFPITVPPLRDHPEDIPLLVQSFLDQLTRKMGVSVAGISKKTMQMLQSYPWPGNVRELKHAVESALINAEGKTLHFELPQIADTELTDFQSFEDMERDYILRVLKAKNWRIGGENSAASVLGMHVNTLRGRMKKLGIKKPTPQ